ncbi:MAG: hypothetical protein LBN37_03755 [Bacteroidales bacterium]|jgi:hypothetical protein|nr:hypothetical protein [Bacteroidales bacterium]
MKYLKSAVLLMAIQFVWVANAFSRNDTIQLGRSFGLQLSGFVRGDYILDTRQGGEAVEGLFLFYPAKPVLDENGKDINATPKSNLTSIASRLSMRFFAPEVLRAKSSAYIEVDFTGTSNTNGIRMRHAYINLAWDKSSLLIGRTWHPFSASCMPNVLALNTGAPFWGFNRSDQLRFNFTPRQWALSAIVDFQSDYASLGPDGKSGVYMRNSIIPEFSIDITHKTNPLQTGVVGSVKTLKPRLFTQNQTAQTYKTNETITTYSAQAYLQYKKANWLIKSQAMYLQNTTDALMIGGYAVSSINPATGHETYTPTQYMNYWVGVDYGKKWQVGCFAGYLHSLGTLDNVAGAWYAREKDMKYMYRIAPHLFYNIGNWQFALELEYTTSAYGTTVDNNHAKIINAKEVSNLRTNLAVMFWL